MKRNGIDNYILIGIVCCLLSHFSLSDVFAQSENSKPGKGKLIAGIALMAGGAAMGIIGGANAFSSDAAGVVFLAGIGVFGAGVALTILGVRDRSKGNKEQSSENSPPDRKFLTKEPALESQFFLGPTKGGAAAGLTLRW